MDRRRLWLSAHIVCLLCHSLCTPGVSLRFHRAASSRYWTARQHAEAQLAEALQTMPAGTLESTTFRFQWTPTQTLVWDYYGPFYDCGSKERLGPMGDGGKWVCEVEGDLQSPGCIVYSLGSNMETGFEEDILRKTKCKIFTFDHTLSKENGVALNEISSRMQFFPYKIGTDQARNTEYQEKSIDTIMRELGHARVDVLKMDIEGGEWNVLEAMLEKGDLPFNQMQLELHLTATTLGRALDVLSRLTQNGYRVFSVEPNLYCCDGALVEYSFIKESV